MLLALEQPVRPNLDIDDAASGDSVKGDGPVGEPAAHDKDPVHGPEMSIHEEDVEPRKTVRTPYTPIASELAEHRDDHSPYRDWCPDCLEAFGREAPHRCENKRSWLPVITCDYLHPPRAEWTPNDSE